MSVPQVVIIGRPNVGKSSVFNWLTGHRIAIVDGTAGVTRDRISHLVCVEDRFLELVDTGGLGIKDKDNLTKAVEEQIEMALESADVILFVVDTREGVLPLDQEVAKRLRYVDKRSFALPTKRTIRHLIPKPTSSTVRPRPVDSHKRPSKPQQRRVIGHDPRAAS